MFANTVDIIGANGYIGRGFCKFFKEKNIKFRKITRVSNDIDSISFEEWCKNLSSSICLYLADPSFIYENDHLKYFSAIKRFDKALKCSSRLFIYVSSSKVYLEKFKGKLSENDKKSNITYYQKLKNRNEKALVENSNEKYLILRIPSFVDSIPKPDTLFHKIVLSNKSGNLSLIGDYSFNQEFLLSKDLFNIVLKILNKANSNPHIFNISSSRNINIMELLNPKFRYCACPRNYSILDNASILSYIKFEFHIPKFSIEDNSIYWIKS